MITLLNTSRRKRSTYNILKQVEKQLLAQGFETQIINVNEYKIDGCRGCQLCIKKDRCNINDDFDELINRLIESEAIIIGTPVYIRNISTDLKIIIDRLCSWYHRPKMTGTYVVSVITTAASGIKNTDKYIKDFCLQFGLNHVGMISSSYVNPNPRNLNKTITKLIKVLNDDIKNYRPSYRQITEFNIQKILAHKITTLDYEYFLDKNWINADYFYECKINIIKRAYGKIIFNILMKVIPDKKKS